MVKEFYSFFANVNLESASKVPDPSKPLKDYFGKLNSSNGIEISSKNLTEG